VDRDLVAARDLAAGRDFTAARDVDRAVFAGFLLLAINTTPWERDRGRLS
jgi:hypothetical protein